MINAAKVSIVCVCGAVIASFLLQGLEGVIPMLLMGMSISAMGMAYTESDIKILKLIKKDK